MWKELLRSIVLISGSLHRILIFQIFAEIIFFLKQRYYTWRSYLKNNRTVKFQAILMSVVSLYGTGCGNRKSPAVRAAAVTSPRDEQGRCF